MDENILEKIIKKKSERLIDLKKKRPIESLLEHPPDSMNYINFKASSYNCLAIFSVTADKIIKIASAP